MYLFGINGLNTKSYGQCLQFNLGCHKNSLQDIYRPKICMEPGDNNIFFWCNIQHVGMYASQTETHRHTHTHTHTQIPSHIPTQRQPMNRLALIKTTYERVGCVCMCVCVCVYVYVCMCVCLCVCCII